MIPEGKGFMVWQHWQLGSPEEIVDHLLRIGCHRLEVKIADGTYPYPFPANLPDCDRLVFLAKNAGLEVYGWHYVYLSNPVGEARIALQRVMQLELDGYQINAEAAAKGRYSQAQAFADTVSEAGLDIPIGLCSYRYPSYHTTLPWLQLLSACTFHNPQVYWEQAHNPAYQLNKSITELTAVKVLPVYPVGIAYPRGSWSPTKADMDEFNGAAQAAQLPGVSWYRLGTALQHGYDEWISQHEWDEPPLTIEDKVEILWNAHPELHP